MENNRKPRPKAWVDRSLCVACGCCVKVCPLTAISVLRGLWAQVDGGRCVGCGRCVKECPASVIELKEAGT
ncbi:Ion-translocating oxidoreductase complex subunit B [Firmicutes bacterium ASF500]|nr:Ion-translocating oxidoreductase complex subunit B [Firmicutes bacterium ASF500]